MILEIKWTKRAEVSFDNIYQYIKLKFGENTAKKFVSQSFEVLELLSLYPKWELLKILIKEFLDLFYQSKLHYFTEQLKIK